MNNYIHILLIDDKPYGEMRMSISEIKQYFKPKYLSDINNCDTIIPFVFGDNEKLGLPKDIFKYCRVFWIRHSKDARQYISYLYDIKRNMGIKKLYTINMTPDIVLYDYALTGGEQFQTNNPIDNNIARKVIPSYLLEKYVKNKIPINSISTINTGSEKDADNEGAYCGGEILNFFNETVIVGAATTRKDGDKVNNQEVALYEELKKLQNNNTFNIKGEDNLNWTTIIPTVLRKLKEEIKQSIRDEKIRIDLENINTLLKGVDENSKLITYTVFGIKEYSIIGLFVNFKEDERHQRIIKWLNDILKILIGENKLDVYNNAVRLQDDLWDTFKSDMFFERIELSEYILRENSTNGLNRLTDDENERFNSLKGRLCKTVKDELIIIDNICSNGDVSLLTKNDKVRKLVILFTVIRLNERWQKFVLNPKNDDNGYFSIAKVQPNFDDLFFALYPFPKKPIVLPFHQVFFKPGDKYSDLDEKNIGKNKFKNVSLSNVVSYDRMTKNILSDVKLTGFNKNQLIPKDNTVNNFEKVLLRSFANRTGLHYKNIPEWLK